MSGSCSVAFPSLSGDEAQDHVLMCGAQVSPAAKPVHGAPSTMLQVGWDLVARPGFCDGPASMPVTVCLSFPESNGAFTPCLHCRAEDLSKCCVNTRPPYDNYRIKN